MDGPWEHTRYVLSLPSPRSRPKVSDVWRHVHNTAHHMTLLARFCRFSLISTTGRLILMNLSYSL
jgi:hypothetical protein